MTIKIYNDSNKIKLLNILFIWDKQVNHCHCVKVVYNLNFHLEFGLNICIWSNAGKMHSLTM